MKKYILLFISALVFTSCSDFLDRYPQDALSPTIFWKTENDAKLALVGCYNDFESGWRVLCRDNASDNGYNFHGHEGWQVIGNGTMSAGTPGTTEYSYDIIRRCNEFLENIDKITFANAEKKENYIAEVRFLRAYRYFVMTQQLGDVPLVKKTFATPDEAKVPRDSRATVEQFIIDELKELTPKLAKSHDSETGRVIRNAGHALLVRVYLFKKMYQEAIDEAKKIEGAALYTDFEGLFLLANEKNSEVLFEINHVENDYKMDFTSFLPNSKGGWSSAVPLQSLVDAYEMADGLTIEEAKAVGKYDETNPYVNRDPRLRHTIVYPGQLYEGSIYNSVTKGNADHPMKENNATKSGYNIKKYMNTISQYASGYWNTGRNIMLIRYAEVLLSLAEAKIELNQIDEEMYSAIDKVRERAGMPKVDRTKYNSQEKLRELVRRERRVEFAFEGMRRWDIIRWSIGKEVLNGDALGCRQGTILDETYPNGDKKVNLDGEHFFVESRKFEDKHNLQPIPQSAIDKNPKLTQNTGY